MRIVFTGGGSGGHIFPIIAVAEKIRVLAPDAELFYAGPHGIGDDEFARVLITPIFILSGKIPRFATPALFKELIKIPFGILFALWHLFWLMPDVIFAKGGFGSVPLVLAGAFYRIPVILHESDSVPGLSNRILAPFAKKIFTAFEPPLQWSKKAEAIGNPVRQELLTATKADAIRVFGLTQQKPVVLVMGGSQGAQQINDLVLAVLNDFLAIAEVLHQCGAAHFDGVLAESRVVLRQDLAPYYHLFPFLDEQGLALAYAASDLVVSRAGSGNIFEIAAAGKPSILIPLLSAAQDHQRANARAILEQGAALVLDMPTLEPHFLLAEIKKLLDNPAEREHLAENIRILGQQDSAQRIAQELLRYS